MTTITIDYTASVFTPAGWRSVTITAEADQTSAGMATVTAVTAIDGEAPAYGMRHRRMTAPPIKRRPWPFPVHPLDYPCPPPPVRPVRTPVAPPPGAPDAPF